MYLKKKENSGIEENESIEVICLIGLLGNRTCGEHVYFFIIASKTRSFFTLLYLNSFDYYFLLPALKSALSFRPMDGFSVQPLILIDPLAFQLNNHYFIHFIFHVHKYSRKYTWNMYHTYLMNLWKPAKTEKDWKKQIYYTFLTQTPFPQRIMFYIIPHVNDILI